MSDNEEPTSAKVPTAFEDEGGGVWWIWKHCTYAEAVLAVVVEQMVNVGAAEAMETLTGCDDGYTLRRQAADDMLNQGVRRVWCLIRADNDEAWDLVEPECPGAVPITRVEVQW